jgi:energy-coupling factor transporter ATP-binding protein EcfA2
MSKIDYNFRRKVQDVLNAELIAKMSGEITGRVKGQDFKIDLGDSIKGVYGDIVVQTPQNSNAIIQNAKNKFEIIKSLAKNKDDFKYFIVFENELSDVDKRYYNEYLKSQVTEKRIEFYDRTDIELLYEKHFDKTPVYKWYEVYPILVGHFLSFANAHVKKRLNPGKELYKKLSKHQGFVNNNSWFKNWSSSFSVLSLDPIHIFTSLNSNKLSVQNRIDRINILLDFFNTKLVYKKINFDGCPTPMAVNILSSRKQQDQDSIWALFVDVASNKKLIEIGNYFEKYKSWYGVDFSSLSQFLFWIKSDSFLPIEYNVKAWLAGNDIRFEIPNDYNSYLELVQNIDSYNSDYDGFNLYGDGGLFREISHICYRIINLGEKEIINSIAFHNWSVENKKDAFEGLKNNRRLDEGLIEVSSQNITNTEKEAVLGKLGFKLVAINILNEVHSGILEKNKVYHFEKSINIGESIEYFPKKNIELYSISRGTEYININITGIVGKNGSGKSSLIEVLFKIINNIAYLKSSDLNLQNLIFVEYLSADLFYLLDGLLYKIELRDSLLKVKSFRLVGKYFEPILEETVEQKIISERFFYTIGVNYSHYALNSKDLGQWIEELFHKNDSYQTPIVLNPWRNEGNVDINRENILANQRLIANLFSPPEGNDDDEILRLTENQEAESIDFELDIKKVEFVYEDKVRKKIIHFHELKSTQKEIIDVVNKVFEINVDANRRHYQLIDIAEKYIVKKLIKISMTYPHFEGGFNSGQLEFKSAESLEQFLRRIQIDPSHITFKLRQAINYLKYPKLWMNLGINFKVTIKDKRAELANFNAVKIQRNPIELVLPTFFKGSINLKNINQNRPEITPFIKLSSGEKQLVYSIHSILYHIRNVDSVIHEKLLKYHKINVVLDEIELYYHPDLQRKYIQTLLRLLKSISISHVDGINFILITHSPYILSDLPSNFVLKLDPYSQKNTEDSLTFGANIHDLLANDFFMSKGFMGEFAQKKIQETITYLNFHIVNNEINRLEKALKKEHIKHLKLKMDYLNSEKKFLSENYSIDFDASNNTIHSELIELIGEPVLNRKLREMYDLAFKSTGLDA